MLSNSLNFYFCAVSPKHGAASSFTPTPTGFHAPYWQGPPQNRRDARPPGFRERPRSPIQLPVKQEAAAPLGECDFTQPKPVSDLRRNSGDLGVDILRSLPFTQSTEREILCSDMFRTATNPPQVSGEGRCSSQAASNIFIWLQRSHISDYSTSTPLSPIIQARGGAAGCS